MALMISLKLNIYALVVCKLMTAHKLYGLQVNPINLRAKLTAFQ